MRVVMSLLFLVAAVTALPVAVPGQQEVALDTNAKRMANGLPPLAPKRLFEASPAYAAERAKRSAT